MSIIQDEIGRFTCSGGGSSDDTDEADKYNKPQNGFFKLNAEINKVETEKPVDVFYRGEKVKKVVKKVETAYKEKLLDVLGKLATPTDVLYATTKKLEAKIKENGLGDKLNQFKGNNAAIDSEFKESLWNIKYYYKLPEKYNKEVGDFLRKNTSDPEHFSNDLRHQYVSAIFARNLGQLSTKVLGELNEFKDGLFPEEPGDTEIDRINNEIGRNYAKLYPSMPRQELLQLMFDEYAQNRQIRIQKMKEKSRRNLNREYM